MPDREYYNNRRRDRRKQMLELLGGRCENCGSRFNLQFDHKNPKAKEFRIADRLDAPLEILEKETKKCRLLCARCHKDKTRDNWEFGQPPARHGTIWYYKKHKCRCDKCKKAMSDYNKTRKEFLKELAKKASLEKFLYYFIPTDVIDSVLNTGLIPKKHTRLLLTKSPIPNDKLGNNDYTILQIDSNMTNAKFTELDEEVVVTTDKIGPEAIVGFSEY